MSAEQEDDPDELSPALTLCWHIVVGVPTCTYTTLLKLYFCAHGSFRVHVNVNFHWPNDIPLGSMLLRSEVVISGFYCRDVEYCKLLLDGVPKNHRISAMIFRRLSQLTSEA